MKTNAMKLHQSNCQTNFGNPGEDDEGLLTVVPAQPGYTVHYLNDPGTDDMFWDSSPVIYWMVFKINPTHPWPAGIQEEWGPHNVLVEDPTGSVYYLGDGYKWDTIADAKAALEGGEIQ